MPRALSQTRALLKTRAHTLFRSSWVSQTLYSKLVTLTRGLSKIHAEDHREPKAFRRHRLDGPMTCHLMPFAPAAELRASCAEKPSPCKELRRLGTFLFHEHHMPRPWLHLRGPVPRAPGLGGGAMASAGSHRRLRKSPGRPPAWVGAHRPPWAPGFGDELAAGLESTRVSALHSGKLLAAGLETQARMTLRRNRLAGMPTVFHDCFPVET